MDVLKGAVSSAPVLEFPNFSREFLLETDASLNGLGTILSQQGRNGKICVIAYASCSLHPSEGLMCNYSQLSWSFSTEVGCNREILGLFVRLEFQVYIDNNPLPHVQKNKLGASQSDHLLVWHCLILSSSTEQAVPTGATDALNHHPFNPSYDIESEIDSDEVEVISYSSVCKAIDQYLNSTKIPTDLKQEAQNINCAVQSIIEEEDKDEIVSMLNAESIFE